MYAINALYAKMAAWLKWLVKMNLKWIYKIKSKKNEHIAWTIIRARTRRQKILTESCHHLFFTFDEYVFDFRTLSSHTNTNNNNKINNNNNNIAYLQGH